MKISVLRWLAGLAGLLLISFARAGGPLPDTTVVLLSEAQGYAHVSVSNSDAVPMLLYTRVEELPGSNGSTVLVLPSVARVQPGARQIVRFVLDKSSQPVRVQQLKRVIFEGLPAKPENGDASGVRFGIAQNLPLILSPAGLVQDDAPWKQVMFSIEGDQLRVRNPGPYVVRLLAEALLLPASAGKLPLPNSFILPGDDFTIALPKGTKAADVSGLRIYPSSPWGFGLQPYEPELVRRAAGA